MWGRFLVHKNVRLVGRYGSAEFNNQLGAILAAVAEMQGRGEIHSAPQHVLMALDAFVGGCSVPIAVYRDRLMALHKDDRQVVDRLLRRQGLVQATLTFEDEEAERAGLTIDQEYTNREIVSRIFEPRSGRSFSLVDPAIYVRRVPGEDVTDLFGIPATTRSALLATVEAARGGEDTSLRREDREAMLTTYAERERTARRRDARTISQLVYSYASNRNPDVNTVAEDLARAYLLLFNRPEEVREVVLLHNVLETAAEHSASVEIRHLAERVRETADYRRRAQKTDTAQRPAEDTVVGWTGWKTGQEGR